MKKEEYVKFIELVEESKEKYFQATGFQAEVIYLEPNFAKELKELGMSMVCGLYVYMDVDVPYGGAVIKRRLADEFCYKA